ncbi:MAG: diguanylate cyclase [Gammaproteobacteria bacterium]|nr:diguanylate cyclase [Gammaproteobacteria bacterium]MBU1926548.1 diguanylate cyclase [Gammaproteobacteria bacterium]
MDVVKVPEEFAPLFQMARSYVQKYFSKKVEDPSNACIEISGERYILVRAASMSIDFFTTIKKFYKDRGEEQAVQVARQFLFDIAHALGKEDAKKFHKKMHLKNPLERLSAGPVHFAYSGWASVNILPESTPTPDENYYLIYNHLYSFESDAWVKEKKESSFPVCIMSAGYSSGWCEESFGMPLVASEILCKAKGDSCCRFIMAPPSKIEAHIQAYKKTRPRLAKKIINYEVPQFFKRKMLEEALKKSEERYRKQFEESLDAMFLVNAKTSVFLDCNLAACRLLEREQSELIGQSDSILNPKTKIIEKFGQRTQAKISEARNAQVVTKQGAVKYVSITASTFELVDGQTVISATLRDVTARKKMEDALKQRLLFEKTLGKIAKSFSQLPIDDIRKGIQQSLAQIGKMLDFDRAYCILFSQEDMTFPSQFDWHSKRLGASKYASQYYFSKLFPKFYEELFSKEIVWIPNIKRLTQAWKSEKQIWMNQNIKSIVCLPLILRTEKIGFICYESIFKQQALKKQDVSLLIAYNEILVAALGRHITKRKLEHLAKFDSLTRLPNRIQFQENADKVIAYSARRHKKFSVLSIDLDKFKEVNDSYGHYVGDLLIQAVASRLQSKIRVEDTVARLGGDEFAALVMDLNSREEAASVAQWVIQSNKTKYVIHDHPIKMTMSIGIACYPEDGEDLETLLNHADRAMYEAKHKGRDTYHFFAEDKKEKSGS